jgi:hypothetical protein
VGNIAGLLVIVLGVAMMVFAAIRSPEAALDINVKEVRPGPRARLDITLATLLLMLAAILLVYLMCTILSFG